MRYLFSFLFFLATCCLSAQSSEQTCYFGFGFEISTNPSWGFGEPVITRIDPYSNAEKAGLKTGDVIMEVDGNATYLRHYELVNSWLFGNTSQEVSLTIRNLNNTFKEVRLSRYCRHVDAITEDELANRYAFYSVEDNNEQRFSLPLQVMANPKADFSDYYTFDFVFADKKTTEIDDYIVHQIEKCLNQRGLTRDVKDPDILIQIYYSYDPNKRYVQDSFSGRGLGKLRYDVDLKRMVKMPVDSVKGENNSLYIKGLVDLGVEFSEKKYLNPGVRTTIWNAEMKEYILDGTFESYCQSLVPLMMAAYPYQVSTSQVNYSVDFKNYNYTGIVYNRYKVSTIDAVDENSPAKEAGFRIGDKVLAVNGISLPGTEQEANNSYENFVGETMAYRDMAAGFYNGNVQSISYPWYQDYYRNIRKEFEKKRYLAGFSYLFAFENYISSKSTDELTFKILRQGAVMTVKVHPQRRRSAQLDEK